MPPYPTGQVHLEALPCMRRAVLHNKEEICGRIAAELRQGQAI